MKQRKKVSLIIVVLFTSLILSMNLCLAADSKAVKVYPGPELRNDQISIITTNDQNLTIMDIDDQVTLDKLTPKGVYNTHLWEGKSPRIVHVLPGKHLIRPCLERTNNRLCSKKFLEIETEPGKTYMVMYEIRASEKAGYSKIGFQIVEKKKE